MLLKFKFSDDDISSVITLSYTGDEGLFENAQEDFQAYGDYNYIGYLKNSNRPIYKHTKTWKNNGAQRNFVSFLFVGWLDKGEKDREGNTIKHSQKNWMVVVSLISKHFI